MFRHLYAKRISMRGTILGFPELDEFILTPIDDSGLQSPFAYLQSIEEEGVGFLVANPFTFYADYELELTVQDRQSIEAMSPEEVIVLAIIRIEDPFHTSTINLMAPLIVNSNTFVGTQIVSPADARYSTKMPLQPVVEEGKL
jgi:Uncharacterized protein conserved in bacteria